MSFTSGNFDFASAVKTGEVFNPSLDEILPKGNYVGRITQCDKGTSSGGYPQLELKLETEQGTSRDWLVISPNEFSVGRLLGLLDGCGLSRPSPEAGEINAQTGELSDVFVSKILGREVGWIVRDEPDREGRLRPRVRGYCKPEMIKHAGPAVLPPGSPSSGNSQQEQNLAF
jgi:hypothetical protein